MLGGEDKRKAKKEKMDNLLKEYTEKYRDMNAQEFYEAIRLRLDYLDFKSSMIDITANSYLAKSSILLGTSIGLSVMHIANNILSHNDLNNTIAYAALNACTIGGMCYYSRKLRNLSKENDSIYMEKTVIDKTYDKKLINDMDKYELLDEVSLEKI